MQLFVYISRIIDIVLIGRVALVVPRGGPGAASAESCTYPAKRNRCFPPPIAERQRLLNVGITCNYVYQQTQNILVIGQIWY